MDSMTPFALVRLLQPMKKMISSVLSGQQMPAVDLVKFSIVPQKYLSPIKIKWILSAADPN